MSHNDRSIVTAAMALSQRSVHTVAPQDYQRHLEVLSNLASRLLDEREQERSGHLPTGTTSPHNTISVGSVISTEAEFASLPIGAVVRGIRHGLVAERVDETEDEYRWLHLGAERGSYEHATIARNLGGALVLWLPDPGAQTATPSRRGGAAAPGVA